LTWIFKVQDPLSFFSLSKHRNHFSAIRTTNSTSSYLKILPSFIRNVSPK
jgi:hypothetical protein